MIRGSVDLCTVAYVVIDDLSRTYLAPLNQRPGPRGRCSDGEIITLSLVAELVRMDDEVAFLAYVRRNHPMHFPGLPERSRYNRRRRALAAATNVLRRQIQHRVWAGLPADERVLCLLDSLPVPVVGFAHATRRHRWRGHAAYGYHATKKQSICGFKRHLLGQGRRTDPGFRASPRQPRRQRPAGAPGRAGAPHRPGPQTPRPHLPQWVNSEVNEAFKGEEGRGLPLP